MKIFITGGTGFIGTHLVRKLRQRNHSLLLLSQQPLKGVNFVEGDLSDVNKWKTEVEKFKPDACVHLAWESLPDYSVDKNRKNINYGLDLFSFLTNIGCKTILSTGSAWEYRGRQPEMAVEGTMLAKPADTFSAAKWMINLWGTALAGEKNRSKKDKNKLSFVWARILYVYGPGQREASLIPYLINCAKKGKVPEIKNISAKNDFIYIEDVAEAISMLLERCKKSREYDLGTGKLTSVIDVARIVAKEFGLQKQWGKIFSENKKGKFSDDGIRADNSRIKKEAGWRPKTNLKEGIKKTIHYKNSSKILSNNN